MMYRKLRFMLCCRYLVGKRSCESGILICINMHNLIRCKTVRSQSLNRKIILSFLAAWEQLLVEFCEMWKWNTARVQGGPLGWMSWQKPWHGLAGAVTALCSPCLLLPELQDTVGSFGEDSHVGVTRGPNSASQQLCSRVKHQDQGKVMNPRTNCTPLCLRAGIRFSSLEIYFHSHLDLPWAWCSSRINGNLHCRPPHCEALLGFFLNLLTWRAASLSLLLRLCSVCERAEEDPALVRAWPVKQGLSPLGSTTLPGNTCWWPPSTGKLQRCILISVPAQPRGCLNQQLQFLKPQSKLEWSYPVSLPFCGEEQSCGNQGSRMCKVKLLSITGCPEIIYLLFCVRESEPEA